MKILGILSVPVFIAGCLIQNYNEDLRVLNKIGWSVIISRGAALVLSTTFPLLLLFTRSKMINYVYYKVIHRYLAKIFVFFSLIHSFSHYINFYTIDQEKIINATMFTINYNSVGGVTGNIMLIFLFFITIYSGKNINFDTFFKVHHLYILFLALYSVHGTFCFVKGVSGQCYPYYSWITVIPSVVLLLFEKVRRFFAPITKIKEIIIFDSGIRFKIDKMFNYSPGDYAYLKAPGLESVFGYHPITISSSPRLDIETMEFNVKDVGTWSNSLKRLAEYDSLTEIQVDGPFKSPVSKHKDYAELILVCSGVGITPFVSIIKDYVAKYLLSRDCLSKSITIMWVSRSRDDIVWFEDIFADIAETTTVEILDIRCWITEPILDPEVVGRITKNEIPVYDAIKRSNIHFNYNRPNFKEIFENFKPKVPKENVGVFVCGSESVCISVGKHCKYDIIYENF
jgi:NADPH oxidase